MKLYKGDLQAAKGFVQMLEQDMNDVDNLKARITEFMGVIGNSKELSGLGYEAVKNKLSEYNSILDKRKSTAIILKTAIDSALSTMENYMEGYTELDDSQIDALRAKVADLKTRLWEYDYFTNSVGKTVKRKTKKNKAVEVVIIATEKLIAKLEQLQPIDTSTWNTVSVASGTIKSLSSMVSSMQAIDVSNLQAFDSVSPLPPMSHVAKPD